MASLAGVDADLVEHRSGVRHGSFFFPSGAERLYAALYVPAAQSRFAVVVCPGWGTEMTKLLQWYHRLAHDLATSGIAALLPHWPGTSDSDGDPMAVTLDRLVDTVVDARSVVSDLAETDQVGLIGMRVGAAVAALAAPRTGASRLALTQPVFDIGAHFDQEATSWRRLPRGPVVPPDWAWGYPLPTGLRPPDTASRLQAALEAFSGKAVIVQYRSPAPAPAPRRLRTLSVWGDWGRPARADHGPLRVTTTRWLRRSLRGTR